LSPPLTIRPATWDDLAAIAELGRVCDLHDFGSAAGEEQDIRDDWELPRVDLATDTWVAEAPDGAVVGYGVVIDEGDGNEFMSTGFVHPEHRGNGIGSQLLERIEARARAMNEARGGVLRAWTAPGEDVASLFRSREFRLARSMLRMDAELDAPIETAAPDGIDVRGFEPQREARDVHAALTEAFAKHYAFVPRTFEDWADELLHRPGFDPGLWCVALDHGEVAGALVGVVRLDMGWIADLGVRERWRRRGVGAALARHAMESFRRRGLGAVGLNVDPENETGAMRLYERLGFRPDKRYDFYEREL
jgi:mycothiol synthase